MIGREIEVLLHEGERGREVFAVGVRLVLEDGRELRSDHAVIDTGFSGAVLIPRRALGLETPADAFTERMDTAAGTTDTLVFPASLSLPGALIADERHDVWACDVPGDQWLLGLRLLRGWLLDLRHGEAGVRAPALRRPI